MGSPCGLRPALLLALLPALGGCCPPGSELPDIVLITLDTTRADHIGTYGYFRSTMPWLDRLAQRSVVFERCVAPMATTLPTHASILTATYPLEHGVLANLRHTGHYFTPSEKLRSFAEVCRDAGYQTAAFVSAVPLKRGSGVEAGFEHFDEPADDARERSAGETNQRVFEWLDSQPERPLFLWVHYFDAHWPHEPPEAYRELFTSGPELDAWIAERRIPERVFRPKAGEHEDARQARNAYDAELRYLDDSMQQLVKRLHQRRRWPRTSMLIVGDHGEALCQHGLTGHGVTWDEQLHVPMILKVPGETPRRIGWTVSVVDALPTLLGLVQAPPLGPFLEQATGSDVLASEFQPRPVVSQDTGRNIDDPRVAVYRYALTGDRFKLVRIESKRSEDEREQRPAVRHRLFDLRADPHELENLAEKLPDVVRDLDRILVDAVRAQEQRGKVLGSGRRAHPADPGLVQNMRDLGYIDDGDGEGADEDPED